MKYKYKVTIRSSVTKQYTIEAEDEDHAADEAHEIFIFDKERDVPEYYERETVHIEEVEA